MRLPPKWLSFVVFFLLLTSCRGATAPMEPAPPGPPAIGADDPAAPAAAPASLEEVALVGHDSLVHERFELIRVGHVADIQAELHLRSGSSYNVLVGMEKSWCANSTARIVALTIPEPPTGRELAPSDDFTAWLEDACWVQGFIVSGSPARVYRFSIQVEGLTPGASQVRIYVERRGSSGADFQFPSSAAVQVEP